MPNFPVAYCEKCRFLLFPQKTIAKGRFIYYNLSYWTMPERKIRLEKETLIDKIGRILSKVGTAVMMNLMFLVACIPVVTIGQAWCGLMSAVRYQIRGDSWWHGFKFGFKTRFLRGILTWIPLLAVDVWLLMDVLQYTQAEVSLMYPISACIMFALMTMLTTAFLVLNVYIPTDVGTWFANATGFVFKAPLQLLVSAAAFWAPVLLCLYRFDYFFYFVMIFVVAYFTLAALGTTILLKSPLMDYLIEARAEGTLLAEEGRTIVNEEETDEEE